MIFEKIQLETDEVILSIIRRHWFFVFSQCLSILVLTIVPLCLYTAVKLFAPIDIIREIAPFTLHLFFLYAAWLLILWMMLTTIWTNYYLDMLCITNRRIIKIDQMGLFRRKTGSFRLEKLQDVNVEINGIVATFLDYGTVHAQTASADMEEFREVFLPKPQEIKAIVLKAADALTQTKL
jgi:uncharacterized membrane protein YdbT with pleckstrin-like domain